MAMEARKAVTRAYCLAKKLIPETKNDLKLRSDLLDTIQKVQRIIEQSEAVNNGNTKLADRLISLKDPDARPIVRGKLGKRVEFGYKLQIQETESGIITGYKLYKGNPSDKVLVEDALRNHIELFGKAPTEMSLDRGYYDSTNETLAREAGVKRVCIPKPGRKSKERAEYESTPTFRRLKRWRSGIEGRISCLKRRFRLNRSMLNGYRKTQIWDQRGQEYVLHRRGTKIGQVKLAVPGTYNVLNSLAAAALALERGLSFDAVTEGLAAYRGARRRFEVSEVGRGYVVDDYAHHPTEIAAVIGGARQRFPQRRLVVAFQPHTYTRTKAFLREFAQALSLADEVWVTEIFGSARENNEEFSAAAIVEMIDDKARFVNMDELEAMGGTILAEGDVLLLLGAGDMYKVKNRW